MKSFENQRSTSKGEGQNEKGHCRHCVCIGGCSLVAVVARFLLLFADLACQSMNPLPFNMEEIINVILACLLIVILWANLASKQ